MSRLKLFLKSINIKRVNNLRLIVPDNFKDVGTKVNDNINKIKGTNIDYIVDPNLVRFNNGDGKCTFEESIITLFLLHFILQPNLFKISIIIWVSNESGWS